MQRLRRWCGLPVVRVAILSFACAAPLWGCGADSRADGTQAENDPREAERRREMREFMETEGKAIKAGINPRRKPMADLMRRHARVSR